MTDSMIVAVGIFAFVMAVIGVIFTIRETDSVILVVGIFAFVMAVIGVIFTIREFQTNVYPQANSPTTTDDERASA